MKNAIATPVNTPASLQAGFTLIELIMVIVVLAALAVTAIPRYINLQVQADQSAVAGVAGSLAAGSAINYAACVAGNAACLGITTSTNMDNCDDVERTVTGATIPTGYTITPSNLGAGAGVATNCSLTGPAPTSATTTFSAISVF